MPGLDDRSKKKLWTCHRVLQLVIMTVAETCRMMVVEGHRGEERQNSLYYEGASKAMFPRSRHNRRPSHAVDIAPVAPGGGIDWDDIEEFCVLGGRVQMAFDILQERGAIEPHWRLVWGGDWDGDEELYDQDLNDFVHFEIRLDPDLDAKNGGRTQQHTRSLDIDPVQAAPPETITVQVHPQTLEPISPPRMSEILAKEGIKESRDVIAAAEAVAVKIVELAKDGIGPTDAVSLIMDGDVREKVVDAVHGVQDLGAELTDLQPEEAEVLATDATRVPFRVWKALIS